jgi:hypothetical protein
MPKYEKGDILVVLKNIHPNDTKNWEKNGKRIYHSIPVGTIVRATKLYIYDKFGNTNTYGALMDPPEPQYDVVPIALDKDHYVRLSQYIVESHLRFATEKEKIRIIAELI